jgi:Plasmid recombination enzyme.
LTAQGITPQEPIRVFGCSPSEAVEQAEAWGDQAKDVKGRKLRIDAPVLLAGVISYPREGEDWQEFKETALEWLKGEYGDNLVSVVEHQDEKHPHLHFYAVPKPGQAFNDLHQGRAASAEAKRNGEPKAAQLRAHNKAMRAWQDRVYTGVCRKFGMARLGPKRQRLTRSEYKSRQLVEKALGIAERAGAAKPLLTQQQKDHLMDGVIGRDVGLIRKERMYSEDELSAVGNRALLTGISMQMNMQGDAAAKAAKELAERQIKVDEVTRRTKAEAEAMAAKLAQKDRELEAYRAALKEKENVLAMSEVERQKQATEIQKLEGYRNDLSDQLNEAEERLG